MYAQFQGKTYSGSGDEDWIYSLPEEDLKKISKLTLGFEQDFAMYENEAYFEGSSYTVHYFDPQEKMFYLGFLEPLQGINAEGFFTSFIEFSSIEIDGDELTAVCVLSDSHGLGTEAFERTVTYKFKMISQDNLTYYCFQSLQAS